MYDITAKFAKNSPLPCWVGYERVPGTAKGAKGSCRKKSPTKVKQKGGGTTKVCLPKAKIALVLFAVGVLIYVDSSIAIIALWQLRNFVANSRPFLVENASTFITRM